MSLGSGHIYDSPTTATPRTGESKLPIRCARLQWWIWPRKQYCDNAVVQGEWRRASRYVVGRTTWGFQNWINPNDLKPRWKACGLIISVRAESSVLEKWSERPSGLAVSFGLGKITREGNLEKKITSTYDTVQKSLLVAGTVLKFDYFGVHRWVGGLIKPVDRLRAWVRGKKSGNRWDGNE